MSTSIWGLDETWLLNIQAKHEYFGAIKAIKNWKTIQCLPSLNFDNLTRAVKHNSFNPHFTRNTDTKVSKKRSKAVRQAKESYVRQVKVFQSETDKDKWIIRSSVRASMKNKSYLSVIVITVNPEDQITIEDASCQCPAGLGKMCTHVCAVLYHWYHFKEDSFCPTSGSNTWKPPTSKILGKRIQEVQFMNPGTSKKVNIPYYRQISEYFDPRPSAFRNPNSKDELLNVLVHKLQVHCPTSLFLQFHCDSSQITESTHGEPTLLSNQTSTVEKPVSNLIELYRENATLSDTEFLHFARKYYNSRNDYLRNATVTQNYSKLWHLLRIGLPTASISHRICTRMTRIIKDEYNLNDPRSLLRQMLLPSSYQSQAMKKGLEMEEYIAQLYLKNVRTAENNFEIAKCGIMFYPDAGLIAGSVDRLLTCDSIPVRVVEIKCVKTLANHGCLKNGKLKVNHGYFYQLQVNMGVHNLTTSDFVIYEDDNNFLILHIDFEPRVFNSIVSLCSTFFVSYVIPFLKNPDMIQALRNKN